MIFFQEKIDRLCVQWNKKPLTEEIFYRLCKRHKVTVHELTLTTSGFYYCVKKKHFIAVDSRLKPPKKLFVLFHEFAHYLMHAPDTGATANFYGVGGRTRKEREADAFALCALMPRTWIEDGTLLENAADEGFPAEMLKERTDLFEKHGI